jgi:hypothetical protein
MQFLIGKGKNPKGLYMNDHNWLLHILCHLGNEPNTLQHSVCVVQHQRLKIHFNLSFHPCLHLPKSPAKETEPH